MGWFSDDSDQAQAYQQVVNAPHKAELSHELIAAAASYEAAKAYEKHVQTNGAPDSHAKAKEFLAAAAGGFIDRLVETKGVSNPSLPHPSGTPYSTFLPIQLDYVDKERAHHADLSDKEAAWEQVNSAGHKADLSHELLAAAASYEAVKKYEEHVANNGAPDSHAKAKEFLAAAAGGFIDRIVETKGLDYIDKKKAEHAAKNQTYEVVTEESYNQVVNAPHKAELSHELIAAAASYEAAKAYEKHVAKNGAPDSHAKAKEIFAGLAGAFIDRIVETKGLDYVDKEKAKHHAKKQVEEVVTEETYTASY
ncbi:hypothetical protein CVT26_004743 [Gymnopilus dilepis]|uniref:Uncharacterized protein n=1 Tax=Gymnopilus dilepis TaxID=231916 RepID=A0A409XZG0_9AGAR|nr:hypothetical protein CVT26_004743 [Gymnopilus dilepis]